LPDFCTIYASGGGFYLLTPHTEGVADLQNKLNQTLLKETGLVLSVDLFESAAFDASFDFPTLWKSIFNKGARNKQRRFAHALNQDYNFFFDSNLGETGGDTERDGITNEEIKKGERVFNVFDTKVKKTTFQQVELGKDLKKANYWTLSTKGKLEDELFDWAIFNQLTDVKPKHTEGASIFSKKLNTIVDNEPFIFYGGNKFPVKPENGIEYPVSLGSLIQNGLGRNASFARLSALSRHLDFFFKGYLNTLWEKETGGEKGKSYIVYSGGDDLFLVGRWDEIIKLALSIREEFKKWVCQNPALSISGGIVLVPGKFPIVQAAEMANEAEKEAKKYRYTEGGIYREKNAFCFLNKALDWDNEFPLVEKLKKKLVDLLNDKKISKSLLGKINTYAAASQPIEGQKQSVRWKWTMAYDLRRYMDTLKDAEAKAFVNSIYIAAVANSDLNHAGKIKSKHDFIVLLQIAARWAEFEYRT
jgi:CRISPR-associated protein Csm1